MVGAGWFLRYDEQVLAIRTGIRHPLQEAGERVGQQEGEDELDWYGQRREKHGSARRSRRSSQGNSPNLELLTLIWRSANPVARVDKGCKKRSVSQHLAKKAGAARHVRPRPRAHARVLM